MGTKVKTPVAGSTSEPAANLTQTNDGQNESSVDQAAPSAAKESALTFPREVAIVNDTAIPFTLASTLVEPGKTELVTVKDADQIARIQTDCEYILSMNEVYAGAEVPALRVTEVN